MLYRSRHSLITLLTALAASGCGNTSAGAVDVDPSDVGNVGGASSPAPTAKPVTWDRNGLIDGRFGIQGSWWSYNDEAAATAVGLAPTLPDPELLGPDGRFGWSTSAKQICMKGVAPQVVRGPDMELAFDAQWGAGIGLNLNNGAAYDARTRGITGFMVDITADDPEAPAPPTLSAILDADSVDPATNHFIDIILPAVDQPLRFSEFGQGTWVTEPTPFTPDAIFAIQFQVYTNTQAPKPYDFCISNFRVLM